MRDVRDMTRYYSGPGFDESEVGPICHGPLSRNITYAVLKKDGSVYLLIDLGHEKGKIVPKLITDITSVWTSSMSEETLAGTAYNIAMTMYR